MEQVILTIRVRQKLDDLLDALITKGYFALVKNADTYVDNLIEFMYSIPTRQHYPNTGNEESLWFCRFKPNRQTTWYILFDVEGETYLITNFFNNYMPDYAMFLKSIKPWLISEGIEETKPTDIPVRVILKASEAIDYAYQHAKQGSLITIMCDVVTDALEQVRKLKEAEDGANL